MIAPAYRQPTPERSHLRLVPRPALQVKADNRAYTAYGAALKAWRSGRREVLLAGPAGTGKSRLWLQKAHYAAMKYPGARILLCRKTRVSMTQSVLITFEKKVVPTGWLESNRLHWNQTDQQYEYPNGSIIAVGGLDKATKIMSSEWDLIYVAEATELLESDWGALISRLRNGVMPYQQLAADCNPGAPTHWLKLRCDRGETLMLHSKHSDNPSVTAAYLAGLRALPRVLKLRLLDGVWAAAEGMVYEEEWNPATHLVDRFDIPASWPRFWAIDWGYRNPFVWQAWAQSPDGILYRYKEIYKTGVVVEDVARQIKQLTAGEPRPRAVICDHDAEDRKTFERHAEVETIAARKAVSLGIQTQKARLRIGGDDKAGMYYLRDSLVEIDPVLAEKYLPLCSEQEYEHYVWDVSNGRKTGEDPVKKFDHGKDTERYLCMYIDDPEDHEIGALDSSLALALSSYRGY